MSRRRAPALALLTAATLALAACSTGPGVGEVARVDVSVPAGEPYGDYAGVVDVTTGPDDAVYVLLRDVTTSGAERGAVVAVDGGTREVTGRVELAPDGYPATVVAAGGEVLVAGYVAQPDGYHRFALEVVDPGTGAVVATRVVAGLPTDIVFGGARAALGPDGLLYVGLTRASGAPVLAAVDPATGTVVASTEGVLADVGADDGRVTVTGLVVHGDTLAVTAEVLDPDAPAELRALLVTVGTDLTGPGTEVDLAPELASARADAVAVTDDGTVVVAVSGGPEAGERSYDGLVTVEPGAGEAVALTPAGTELAGGGLTDLLVRGGTAWLVHQGPDGDTSLLTVDLAGGTASDPVALCDGEEAALAAGPAGGLYLAASCEGPALLVLDPA
ncbi:hypothetical protein [Blastococcus sp. SYSU D00820]